MSKWKIKDKSKRNMNPVMIFAVNCINWLQIGNLIINDAKIILRMNILGFMEKY